LTNKLSTLKLETCDIHAWKLQLELEIVKAGHAPHDPKPPIRFQETVAERLPSFFL
jgi:hypothetical protein